MSHESQNRTSHISKGLCRLKKTKIASYGEQYGCIKTTFYLLNENQQSLGHAIAFSPPIFMG
jgi:hypothetical protein